MNCKKRRDDLKLFLKRREKDPLAEVTNKNHNITSESILRLPDLHCCKDCKYIYSCLAGKQVSIYIAGNEELPCYQKNGGIQFHYHHSCVLVFDEINHRITDGHWYGYTVTTSRAIRWYLDALSWCGMITPKEEFRALTWIRNYSRKEETTSCWCDLRKPLPDE